MFTPQESSGRRKNWGAVYVILAILGLLVLTPYFRPQTLGISANLAVGWGALMLIGYGTAAVGAFCSGARLWLENAGAWLGHAGLSIYVVVLVQAAVVYGEVGRAPQTVGFIALLVILVSRSFRIQSYLKKMRQLTDIVRNTQNRDTPQ